MTAEQSSDSGRQRTVAELLKQYGGSGDSGGSGGGGRRHRRSAEPEEPQAVPPARPDPLSALEPRAPMDAAMDVHPDSPPAPSGQSGLGWLSGHSEWNRSAPGLGGGDAPAWERPPAAPPAFGAPPSAPPPPSTSGAFPASPLSGSGYPALTGTGGPPTQAFHGGIYQSDPVPRPPENPTDQMPRFGQLDDPGPSTEVASRPLDVGFVQVPVGSAEEPESRAGGLDLAEDEELDSDDLDEDEEPDEDDDEAPAGLTDLDDLEDEDEGGGFKAWALLAAQGVLGAVAGGALWIGFSYLWHNLPVVALVAAAAATGGLVFLVRTIRGSDDMRTTMLAVLVGLVVTISPVVLMLATS